MPQSPSTSPAPRPPFEALKRRLPILLGLMTLAAAITLWGKDISPPVPWRDVPLSKPPVGYATSQSCKRCHEQEHQSWHASFHRSMTQRADAQSVLAPWQEHQLSLEGGIYRLFRKNGQFWLNLPDPDAVAARRLADRKSTSNLPAPQQVDRQVVMTTGSHHYQTYWVRGERGNELWQVPFVYHLQERRFLPRQAVFLQPPEDAEHSPRWNSNCLQCHAVGAQPNHDLQADAFDTTVAELAIACESCHGPAAAHVAKHDTWSYWLGLTELEDSKSSIVNPARLASDKSSEVCGQCHSYFLPSDPETWWHSGFVGQQPPGQDLELARTILNFNRDSKDSNLALNANLSSIFYGDGTVRVGGREYNGLVESKCYSAGQGQRKLGCLSCHEMHGDSPDKQLRIQAQSNQVCSECHTAIASQLSAHTHHLEASSGSQCVNCHMPHTSYALLRGLRSHRIQSPNAHRTRDLGIPNACNLCHLDRSLSWTGKHLNHWYAQAQLEGPSSTTPQVVLEALSSEAGVRAVAVHALGWQEAKQASSTLAQPRVLVEALADPYSAIRFMAARALRSYEGFENSRVDFVAEPEERKSIQQRLRRFAQTRPISPPLPEGPSAWWSPASLEKLVEQRDNRPVRISE